MHDWIGAGRESVQVTAARVELARYDWSTYRAPTGNGFGIPDIFMRIIEADSDSDLLGCTLEYRLEVQSMVYEVALPAVGVIVAAYAESLPVAAEMELLNVLHNIITGEPHASELEMGNYDLVERCVERAREGIWVMYSKLSKINADFMLDVLDVVDLDRARFAAFRDRWQVD